MTNKHRRNSLRLKGFDYSQPGEYFVTICTLHRRSILGTVEKGEIRLSPTGEIADRCWRKIPEHFPATKVDTFQIMPNHMHGVVVIRDHSVRVEYIQPLQGNSGGPSGFQHVTPGSLESIIRTFKAAVTREARKRKVIHSPIWQRSFYDYIIRDDIDHFFIQEYIELNPVLWHLDIDNPKPGGDSLDDLREQLRSKHGLTGNELERIIEHEACYRIWRDRTSHGDPDQSL